MTYAPDHALIATPIGMIAIWGDDDAVSRVQIDGADSAGQARRGSARAVIAAAEQVSAYFTGALKRFDLPLIALKSARGEALRAAIAAVGYGETLSYGALAARIGSGPRAIGQACARNPYPLIIPCHRILGAATAIGHYSAGDGIKTKTSLLDHEARILGKDFPWAA